MTKGYSWKQIKPSGGQPGLVIVVRRWYFEELEEFAEISILSRVLIG
jgi:hypothetical protein